MVNSITIFYWRKIAFKRKHKNRSKSVLRPWAAIKRNWKSKLFRNLFLMKVKTHLFWIEWFEGSYFVFFPVFLFFFFFFLFLIKNFLSPAGLEPGTFCSESGDATNTPPLSPFNQVNSSCFLTLISEILTALKRRKTRAKEC